MGMTAGGQVKAFAVAAMAAAFVLSGSVPADAAPGAREKLVVLAGSSHYLAYAEYPVSADGHANDEHGALHVLAAHGFDRDLGATFADTDPRSADRYEFSIVGSILTGHSPGDATQVQWWNLAAGTSGTGTLPTGARWQGSAPEGWVLVEADDTTLAVESTAGDLTSYGQPLPAEVQLPGVIDAISGPDGVVSIGEDSATLAYQRWGSPADIVPLNLGNGAGSDAFRCDSVSNAVVGCVDTGPDGQGTADIAVPLDGSTLRSYHGCGTGPVALDQKVVFVCGDKPAHPRFASGSATVTRSRVAVASVSGVHAFGSFVTAAAGGHEVIAIAGAHSDGRPLVTLPGPAAQLDADNLRTAASAVETEALNGGALRSAPSYLLPAQILLASADALIATARAEDPSRTPVDTRPVMGPLPRNLAHHSARHPHHRHITATHTLARFSHRRPDRGSGGIGVHRNHGGAKPAPFQRVDGVYVDPRLPVLTNPTVGMVALQAALAKLGQPYVWAAAGPKTFDCSGLVQWAYAHAGLRFTHFSGTQWNEGRLIPAHDILPGDLILFEYHHSETIHHVGIYLGAGWMVNAPFTGQYVDVVRVPSGVAGVVRP
jgi:cell wall-associated NlpC family hydrolase